MRRPAAARRLGPLVVAGLALAVAGPAAAALPEPVGRALAAAGVPASAVAVVVAEAGAPAPLVAHGAQRSMNPASVMKLVTSFAALELLGPDYRWKTEAYLAGPLAEGTLHGDLVLKGYGDPKITIEQWEAFVADLRARGLARVTGDLVLDRSWFRLPPHDPARFDGDPQRPYNVGPDALLISFKSVRFVFAPDPAGGAAAVRVEPPLPQIAVGPAPRLADGACNDWHATLAAAFADAGSRATARFAGSYPARCGERDWYVALLDAPTYALGMFAAYFRAAGGEFDGGVRAGRAPAGAAPFATLASPPLAEIVRDVNKRSNNVMARQMFLTLATVDHPPPATLERAEATVHRWLRARGIRMTGLVLENGAGLSRRERATALGLAQLLAAADASRVRDQFAASLAIAAVDGTVEKRFQDGAVAGQALLKTGTLEGVKSLAGYVTAADGRRWIVVALVNHPNAAAAQPALDVLVQWVHERAGRR